MSIGHTYLIFRFTDQPVSKKGARENKLKFIHNLCLEGVPFPKNLKIKKIMKFSKKKIFFKMFVFSAENVYYRNGKRNIPGNLYWPLAIVFVANTFLVVI